MQVRGQRNSEIALSGLNVTSALEENTLFYLKVFQSRTSYPRPPEREYQEPWLYWKSALDNLTRHELCNIVSILSAFLELVIWLYWISRCKKCCSSLVPPIEPGGSRGSSNSVYGGLNQDLTQASPSPEKSTASLYDIWSSRADPRHCPFRQLGIRSSNTTKGIKGSIPSSNYVKIMQFLLLFLASHCFSYR